ncbi:hypothetical protein ACFU5I_03095 [Streptomyces libani]|uniref:hypothetical protein n=1 Tax=Streptomyces nigrescens TaxID=1920 RepID=UPI00367F3D95
MEILRIRYLAPQPLEELQCVAQTRRGRRCRHPVLDPTASAGAWILAPAYPLRGQTALPAAHLALYSLNSAAYPEQLRWRSQRCTVHAGVSTATDLAMTGWQLFDPLLHHAHIHTRLPAGTPTPPEN